MDDTASCWLERLFFIRDSDDTEACGSTTALIVISTDLIFHLPALHLIEIIWTLSVDIADLSNMPNQIIDEQEI